jgi:hypothetical protein
LKICKLGGIIFAIAFAARGEGSHPGPAGDAGVYDMDRPGELENPLTVPAGHAELIDYAVGANAAAREDAFGTGGSAVYLDSNLRFGVTDRWEGDLILDTFLHSTASDDDGPASSGGAGYATLQAKWNFLKSKTGDFAVGLAPFVRLPINRRIGGSAQSALGLTLPFEVDLENGWELDGSSSVSRLPSDSGDRPTQWENQASLERALTTRLKAYLELQLQVGDGPPLWAAEFGLTWRLSRSLLVDLGTSLGLGRNSQGRIVYSGLGWSF